MREEMENMWQAMKGSHYQRVIDQLTVSIREQSSLEDAFEAALGAVVKAIHAETGTLWFFDRFQTGRIYPKAVYNGSDLAGVSLAPGEGIAGQVIGNGKSVIIKDCQKDSRWAGRVDAKTGFITRSMICVPLVLGKMSIGSIQIINNRRGQLFDEKDLSFTEHLAEEIVQLLKEQGLLEEYLKDAPKDMTAPIDYTFRQLFVESSARDMDRRIHAMPEFVALSYREQQEILQLCKQLREHFTKRR